MLMTIGLALLALGVLWLRGAVLSEESPARPGWLQRFFTGQIMAVIVAVTLGSGLILVARGAVLDVWKTAGIVDVLSWAAVLALAVLAWRGLGRAMLRQHGGDGAAVLRMPAPGPTAPAALSTDQRQEKRAA